jgi:two-component system sensor histidine kinase DesK
MANVVRHAHAHTVRLELEFDGELCCLVLVDDGEGIDLAHPSFRWSHGLTGMRQRVRALGGHLSLDSERGRGTRLRVELPRRPQ